MLPVRDRLKVLAAGAAVVLAAVAGAGTGLLMKGSQPPGAGSAPAAHSPAAVSSFAAFAGGWSGHGGGVEIQADGSFTISRRTYTWCYESSPPCDKIVSNTIIAGDVASGHLSSSSGQKATGVVTKTTDAKATPTGAIAFTLHPVTRTLSVSGIGNLCSPKAFAGTCGA
jgi:hypothetical protein